MKLPELRAYLGLGAAASLEQALGAARDKERAWTGAETDASRGTLAAQATARRAEFEAQLAALKAKGVPPTSPQYRSFEAEARKWQQRLRLLGLLQALDAFEASATAIAALIEEKRRSRAEMELGKLRPLLTRLPDELAARFADLEADLTDAFPTPGSTLAAPTPGTPAPPTPTPAPAPVDSPGPRSDDRDITAAATLASPTPAEGRPAEPATPSPTPAVGGLVAGQKVFRRYALRRILGRGGMGIVWLARDEELERDVALKFLPDLVAFNRGAVAELKRETRHALELTHPNILRSYDFIHDEAAAAISMEYVDGDSLANLRPDQPGGVFEVAQLRGWIEQLCAALEYAHTQVRLVHRDLKPANLLVDRGGHLKVADFGIAHRLSESVTRMTHTSAPSGTLVYSSPQQLAGEPPSVADDIYGLGATLYELLTGKPPFYSGDIAAQVQGKTAPSVAQRRRELGVENAAEVPPEWEATIAACLAKESALRPRNARGVAARLALSVTMPAGEGGSAGGPESSAAAQLEGASAPAEHAVGAAGLDSGPVPSLGLWEPVEGALGPSDGVAAAAATWGDPQAGTRPTGSPEEAAPGSEVADPPRVKAARSHRWRRNVAAEVIAVVVLAVGIGLYRGASLSRERARQRPTNPSPFQMDTNRWAWLRPGTFIMGSPPTEQDRAGDEGPQMAVTLTKGFWMSRHEVTQGEYQAVTGRYPSAFTGDLNRPVEQVNWIDATNYCARLTAQERAAGRLPAGWAYRLPTEAEWEYAARAGTTTRFSYGDDPGYSQLSNYAWYSSNSATSTQPVGGKQPNPWGLYDVSGNVWEWCLDWYRTYPGGSATDPVGPGSGSNRVLRGGGWWNNGQVCRSAHRRGNRTPDARGNGIGFRAVLALGTIGVPVAPAEEALVREDAVTNAVAPGVATTKVTGQIQPGSAPANAPPFPMDTNRWAWIRPGTFTMGSPATEQDRFGNEAPQTVVTLTKGFWMGKYEVTQGEYLAVVGDNPSSFTGDLKRPVEGVSWIDATNYCGRLTAQERAAGRLPAGWAYRLPTEAEWEYAARAGTTTRFSYGDDPGYSKLSNYAWYGGTSATSTQPVGRKQPNSWGLYDLYGNVREWCWDRHGPYPGGRVSDPTGPASGSACVLRGGGWSAGGQHCRSAFRGGLAPGSRSSRIGFRAVLAAGQP